MRLFGRHFDTGQCVRLDIAQRRVARVAPCRPGPDEAARWPWVAPGLIDVQVNGYGGQEFSSATLTAEKVAEISRVIDTFGVTRYCPTLTTESPHVMQHALRTITAACEESPEVGRRIAGIHLEGPYLCTEDGPRGAHPRQHCRSPDWNEFQQSQEAAGGRIRLLTMAVEFDRAAEFIGRVVRTGVVVAIGHTAADSSQICAAVDAGARLSTHLGNGSHPMMPRHSNYLWDQLAEDRLEASLIVDGHHLPPPVVKTFVRAKTPERCILVSDLAGQAGLPPGRYQGDLCEVEVQPSGRLVVAGQTEIMAGASEPLGTGVANVMHFAGLGLAQAIRTAAHHPARLLGLEPVGLEPGCSADLVLFDLAGPSDPSAARRLVVRTTMMAGTVVFGSVWRPEWEPRGSG